MTEGCRDGQNLRNVRPLGHEESAQPGSNGAREARARQLPALDLMDLPASAWVMWTAFASRSIRRAGETRLAGPEVKESNSALEAAE